MSYAGNLLESALCIAFGVLLPILFHMFGIAGAIFLPMHIPVLIAGLLLGSRQGSIVGLTTPLLSSLFTGMPPVMPVLPVMMPELAVYGYTAGYLYENRRLPLTFALIGAMVAGRVAAMLMAYGMAVSLNIHLQPMTYVTGAVIQGVPGIVVQLVLIPVLVSRLRKIRNRTSMEGSL